MSANGHEMTDFEEGGRDPQYFNEVSHSKKNKTF
jgi:hypothetical protein